jgi:DNA repair exonuclease SbcCD nuclease subunit
MKIALISDLHFGCRKGSKVFYESQKRYFETEFIPLLEEKNITELYILGDLWDNRESINAKVQNVVFHIFERLAELKINITILIGNHDTQYKTNIETHTLKYLSLFPNIKVIDQITDVDIDGLGVTLFPWQVDDMFTVRTYENRIAFGHFDISGCLLNKTTVQEGGTGQSFFWKNFDKTFSGHFHTQSHYDGPQGQTIDYIGSPYHLNRNDIDTDKGFMILDTDTLEFERFNSTTPLKYIKVKYPLDISEIDIPNNIIDVHVTISDKFNSKNLTKYVQSIETNLAGEPINVNVVPHYSIDDGGPMIVEEDLSKIKSIPDMIQSKLSGIENMEPDMKTYVKQYVQEVYESCQAIE